MSINHVSNNTCGTERCSMIALFHSYTKSLLDCGSPAGSYANPSTLNTAFNIATGAFTTSPSASICVEAGEPP